MANLKRFNIPSAETNPEGISESPARKKSAKSEKVTNNVSAQRKKLKAALTRVKNDIDPMEFRNGPAGEQWVASLILIANAEGGISLKEISKKTFIVQPKVSVVTTKYADLGWIKKGELEGHGAGRSLRVRITPTGKAKAAELLATYRERLLDDDWGEVLGLEN